MSIIGSNILAGASGSGVSAYEIEQSLRFNSADSAYLNRTPASAGNRKTWTWSGWVKGGVLARGTLFQSPGAGGFGVEGFIDLGPDLRLQFDYNGGSQLRLVTSQVFRDVSAWYHIVAVVDTTNATSTDRLRLYVNGSRVTAFSSSNYPSQNANGTLNQAYAHALGARTTPATYWNGYLAEVNFIDGTALDPTDFGEFDNNGVWRPIEYTGSHGTNGFYLNFADNSGTTSTTLGKDSSGNSNNWTPNGFSVTAGAGNDVLSDTPTTNWATLNPLKATGASITNGNLDFSNGAVDQYLSVGTIGVTSGKWYWETTKTGGSNGSTGIAQDSVNTNRYVGQSADSWGYVYTGIKSNNATHSTYGNSYTTNDVIGVALDADAGSLYFYKNGVVQNSGTAAYTGLTSGPYFPAVGAYDSNFTVNFGQRAFAYTPPTGFKALNTANLPEPTVKDGGDHFNTVLYTGTGVDNHAITGVGFQPDWVWLKTRSVSDNHLLQDAVRGAQKQLFSNLTEQELSATTQVKSFDNDGFTVGTDSGANGSGRTFAAWNWKANGAGSSNTDGTITSTVSANPSAGFSIVSYTGTGSNATVGHGLGVAPAMVIIKSRTTGDFWVVGHTSLGFTTDNYLRLNADSAKEAAGGVAWNNTAPTSTVVHIGSSSVLNGNGNNYVAYCFAEVEGYSKISSWTGNGNADGVYIHCGFSPSFIMFKRTDSAANWVVFDTARTPNNVVQYALFPDIPFQENFSANYSTDILSNGFKLRTQYFHNISGSNHVFIAFASNPFGGSGVSPATAR